MTDEAKRELDRKVWRAFWGDEFPMLLIVFGPWVAIGVGLLLMGVIGSIGCAYEQVWIDGFESCAKDPAQ